MKLKPDFALRQIAENWVVIPVGEQTLNMPGILTANESGAFLWKLLEQEQTVDSLTNAMLAEYDADPDRVRQDVLEFLEKLRDAGCME